MSYTMKTRWPAGFSLLTARGLILLLAGSALGVEAPPAPALAFPGAEGFGAQATGGRGGAIYHVTNLDDAGPGSFRDAVSKGKRMVLFDIAGIIRLKSDVLVNSDLTLAGQSAPGQGISLYGRSVSLIGVSNVIVRYLRFREGINGDKGKCAVNLMGARNVILDHDSIQWGRWDCLGVIEGSHAVTIQNCVIGEGLAPQHFGGLVDAGTDVTLSHNLWIHNQNRNPKAKGAIQYINNVVYNWGDTGLVGGHSGDEHHLDVIGNYFIKGPASTEHFLAQFTSTDNVFQKDNRADLDCDGQLNGRAVVETDFDDGKSSPTFVTAERLHPPVPVTIEDPATACQKVLASAGCSLRRDAVDTRLIGEANSFGRKGRIAPDEDATGGIGKLEGGKPPTSSAGDGIPDAWKTARGLDLKSPEIANGDYNHDGFTNLEKFLNEIGGR